VPCSSLRPRWLLLIAAAWSLSSSAAATDVEREVAPGVRVLHRSLQDPRKEIHAVWVDLQTPSVALRATRADEQGQTVSEFAAGTGAIAAINGDFFSDGFDPLGLAIGDGALWSTDTASWSFLACDVAGRCQIDAPGLVTAADPTWQLAVGGNFVLLTPDFHWSAADDETCGPSPTAFCTTEHPRTAVGLSADGATLIMVVVEGRQEFTGLRVSALASLMAELGAAWALNLDGGGSSAMVVDGVRVSGRPTNEPNERRVANHLAVVRTCAALPPEGGIIDDGDPCVQIGGPPASIRVVTDAGFAGDLRWTKATDDDEPANFARYTIRPSEPGRYRLEAFTASSHATSRQTIYGLQGAGLDQRVVVDQTAVNGFVLVAELDLPTSPTTVFIGDDTGEPLASDRRIVFDALRVTRLDLPPPEDPTDPDPPDDVVDDGGESGGDGGDGGDGDDGGDGGDGVIDGDGGATSGEPPTDPEDDDEPIIVTVEQRGCATTGDGAALFVVVLSLSRRRRSTTGPGATASCEPR
jgi:hypothetical protein